MPKSIQTPKDLSKIPGIGSKIISKLEGSYNNNDDIINKLISGNVQELSNNLGYSSKKTLNIIKKAHQYLYDKNMNILKTKDSKEIYQDIINLISKFVSNKVTKDKLFLLLPQNSSHINEIKQSIDRINKAKQDLSEFKDIPYLRSKLSKIEKWKKSKRNQYSYEKCIVTDDFKYFEKLNNISELKEIEIIEINNFEEIIEISETYEFVYIFSDNIDTYDMPQNVIYLEKPDINTISPEKTIIEYSKNKKSLLNAIKIIKRLYKLADDNLFKKEILNFDFEKIDKLQKSLNFIEEDGSLSYGIDKQIDKLRNTISKFDEIVDNTTSELNEKISEELKKSSIKLRADKVMSIVKRISESDFEAVNGFISEDLMLMLEETIDQAEKDLAEKLDLEEEQYYLIQNKIYSFDEFNFPIEVNLEIVDKLRHIIQSKIKLSEYKLLLDISKKLESEIEISKKIISKVFDFDYLFGLAQFAKQYSLNPPKIQLKASGIAFKSANNIFLSNDSKVQKITYKVGKTNLKIIDSNENVVLLSGANSGGKTTLLTLIAQISILVSLGLPVPAEDAEVGIFDSIYFFKKVTGSKSLSAGAFEVVLNKFCEVLTDSNSKLVLADELESISEPSASSKVISSLIEQLKDQKNNLCLFVSHLCREIKEQLASEVRIDGIEAKGLDKDLNLLVDRNPKFRYLARSTPELIIKRLAEINKENDKKKIYTEILKKF